MGKRTSGETALRSLFRDHLVVPRCLFSTPLRHTIIDKDDPLVSEPVLSSCA